jgi:hypothetical protein
VELLEQSALNESAHCARCGAAIFRWDQRLPSRQAASRQPALPLKLVRVRNWCAEFRVTCKSCRSRCLVKIDLPSNTYTLGPEDSEVTLVPEALRRRSAL